MTNQHTAKLYITAFIMLAVLSGTAPVKADMLDNFSGGLTGWESVHDGTGYSARVTDGVLESTLNAPEDCAAYGIKKHFFVPAVSSRRITITFDAAFESTGLQDDFVWLELHLLDEGGSALDGKIIYGNGIIGDFQRPFSSTYHELDAAAGTHLIALVELFGERSFSALEVRIMHYGCSDPAQRNTVYFDNLQLLGTSIGYSLEPQETPDIGDSTDNSSTYITGTADDNDNATDSYDPEPAPETA
ncbi:MAG: hypothetical protein GY868_13075, partial [Deltaproteobacteria bacterium]|nr:hypothetical protein [Deltaproteobacteria bacterium]